MPEDRASMLQIQYAFLISGAKNTHEKEIRGTFFTTLASLAAQSKNQTCKNGMIFENVCY